MQRRELETICALLFEICKAGVSAKAFTYYYVVFFLAKALPVLHCKFSKCPHNTFFFFYLLGPFFQLFPEIKKCYLMSTVEAAEEEMALTKSVEASGILALLECHRNTNFALMELMFNLMSNGHKTIK